MTNNKILQDNDQTGAQPPRVNIIIVGAGISGLTSAAKILQKERSLQVKILEASNVVGGQVADTRLGEIGGKWITEDQYHIQQLLQELEVPTRRRAVLAPDLKRCWDIDVGIFSMLAKYELNRYIQELEESVYLFKPGRFNAQNRSKTMFKHICNRLFFNKSRTFMNNLVLLVCGMDARDVTYIEFMGVCYTCGGLGMLIDLYIQFPSTLTEISSSHLLQALLEKIKYAEILTWRKVYDIRHYKDYVEVRDSERQVHTADAVILAVPWNSLQDINISPQMPMELRKPPLAVERSKHMITSFIAKYNEGHWRNAGYSGNFYCSEPLIIGHEYRPTTYSGMAIHEEGIEPLVRSIALQALAQHFGEQMLLPTEFYQRTYELSTTTNVPFTTPWNRIIWSSSAAAATCYRGRLGGAVQSGLRAAMNSLLVVRPQTVNWQDIAEIQCTPRILHRDAGYITLWASSLNLYNVTYYSLIFYGLVTVLRYIYNRN